MGLDSMAKSISPEQAVSTSKVSRAEQYTYIFICGFALFSNVSLAIGNIFLALAALSLVYKLILDRNGIKDIFVLDRGLIYTFLAVWLTSFISTIHSVIEPPYGVVSPAPMTDIVRFLEYFVYRPLPAIIILCTIREKNKLKIIAACWLASLIINGGFAIHDWVMHFNREYWRFGGKITTMAQASSLTYAIPIALIWFLKKQGRYKLLPGVIFLYLSLLFLINGTRGAWLAMLIVLLAAGFLAVKQKLRFLIAIALCGILSFNLVQSVPQLSNRTATIADNNFQSNSERLLVWDSAIKIVKDYPVFGIGFNDFGDAYRTIYISPLAKEPELAHAHNNILHVAAENGLVGLLALLSFFLYYLYFSLAKFIKTKHLSYLVFFTIFSGVMLHGMTEYTFGTSVTMKCFYLGLAMCLAWARLDSECH